MKVRPNAKLMVSEITLGWMGAAKIVGHQLYIGGGDYDMRRSGRRLSIYETNDLEKSLWEIAAITCNDDESIGTIQISSNNKNALGLVKKTIIEILGDYDVDIIEVLE